jgi:hypothetical protein
MRFDYVRSMAFQSTTKFLPRSRWVIGSLLFIADKFRDLNLPELESLGQKLAAAHKPQFKTVS